MSTHLMLNTAFGSAGDVAEEALARIMAKRRSQRAPRFATGWSECDSHAVWRLTTDAGDDVAWDPSLASELSAELGGFVVSADASRAQGRFGFAAFFAGRGIEFAHRDVNGRILTLPEPLPEPIGAPDDVFPRVAEIYLRLTGFPMSRQSVPPHTVARDLWRPFAPRPSESISTAPARLSMAIFPLADAAAVEEVLGKFGAARRLGWRCRAAETSTAIPYVVLARDGTMDLSLCAEICQRLSVPAAGVSLAGWDRPFQWWSQQAGEPPIEGIGTGAFEFIHRLTFATAIIGERPGLLHV